MTTTEPAPRAPWLNEQSYAAILGDYISLIGVDPGSSMEVDRRMVAKVARFLIDHEELGEGMPADSGDPNTRKLLQLGFFLYLWQDWYSNDWNK